ncbi:MAG: 2-hydroxychromene-2-carboxylate isomerase [Alphaproteobacteria bacterium]|nr:2-hydroxychromene-2-carboxylate isomerase [Alphaproteobacteria bacterium]
MAAHIDYYFSLNSPWTYLGSARFTEMVRLHHATVTVMPVDIGQIFVQSGGLPFAKRAPQRQAYRLVELQRWRDHLGLPLNIRPKFFPANDNLAARLVIAAREAGYDAMSLAHAILRAVWAEERDIADTDTLSHIVRVRGLEAAPLFASAHSDAIKAALQAGTDKAIAAQVFGAPSYVLDGEIFWGQDRLEFLDRALNRRD